MYRVFEALAWFVFTGVVGSLIWGPTMPVLAGALLVSVMLSVLRQNIMLHGEGF